MSSEENEASQAMPEGAGERERRQRATRARILLALIVLLVTTWGSCDSPTRPDLVSPTVRITRPADGDTLLGPVVLQAEATDDRAVERVTFFVDSTILGQETAVPYELLWDVVPWADDRSHRILASASDASGNVGYSDTVAVVVSEDAIPRPLLVYPADGRYFVYTSAVHFRWHPLREVAAYGIEVASRPDFSELEFVQEAADTTTSWFAPPCGHFFWRVRARDAAGEWGVWSSVWDFTHGGGCVTFAKTFGGTADDEARDVIVDDDGGFVIVGYTDSYAATNRDVWLIKTDEAGEEVWSRTLLPGLRRTGNAVRKCRDGGFIVAATSQWEEWADGGWQPRWTAWLVKTNATGVVEWSRPDPEGEDWNTDARSICETEDGGYVFVGRASERRGQDRLLVVKADALGVEQWRRRFDEDTAVGRSVEPTSDGGLLIAGNVWGDPDDPASVAGWLLRTDSAGDTLWTRRFNGAGQSVATCVRQTRDQGCIFTGWTMADTWLVRTVPNGVEEWSRIFVGTYDDKGFGVEETHDGGYVITGEDGGVLFLIRTHSDGTEEWNRRFPAPRAGVGYAVHQTPDAGYVVAGGIDTDGPNGYDVWLIKTNPIGEVPLD